MEKIQIFTLQNFEVSIPLHQKSQLQQLLPKKKQKSMKVHEIDVSFSKKKPLEISWNRLFFQHETKETRNFWTFLPDSTRFPTDFTESTEAPQRCRNPATSARASRASCRACSARPAGFFKMKPEDGNHLSLVINTII